MADEKVCCPKFDPKPWDEKTIKWDKKKFVTGDVFCLFHIPVNMGQVITKLWKRVDAVKAGTEMKDWILLSEDLSPWTSRQYYAVTKSVPGMNNTTISGTFLTKVFEGPYQNAPKWYGEMENYVKTRGKKVKKIYFYYTTCPKCAKKWGKNYVVLMAKIN